MSTPGNNRPVRAALLLVVLVLGIGVVFAGAAAGADGGTQAEDNVTVTLVGDEDVDDGPATIAMFADELPPEFDTQYRNITAVDDTLIAETDVFVIYNVGAGANGTELIEAVESDIRTGAVYLDQWGSSSNGIPDRSAVIGDPADTFQDTQSSGDSPEWVVQQDHPIFDGVANASEAVEIHTASFADHTWFSGASAETIAEVDQGFGGPEGPAVAVDNDTGSVLLSSIGVAFPGASDYTAEANQTFANAVEFAEPPDLEDSYFAVSNLSAPAVGEVGEEINVSATVENIGNQSGEQTVEFVFDGTEVANTTVQLDSGANTTVEFSPTLPDEGGEFLHGISTANESQFASITVEAPFFAVSELSAPREAGTGAEINVSATITNTGNVSGTKTVEFRFDGNVVANTTETLNAGENTTVEFTPTLPGQEGFFEHGVFTEDDSETAEIGVGVTFTDVAVVENTAGDGEPAQTVSMFESELSLGFTVEIVSSADVLPNNLTDEYDVLVVQDIDEGSVDATALVNTIENDTDTGAIYLDQSNFGDTFGIEDRSDAIGQPGQKDDTTSGEEPVEYLIQEDHPIFEGVGTAGDTVNLTDGEDNRAWFSDTTATVLADVGDQDEVSGAGVAVDAESQVVLLSSIMAHSLDSPDEFTAAANQTLANAVEFVDPAETVANFLVSDLDAPTEAGAGTEINVSATVTNIGFANGTQDVEFVFNGSVVANTTVELNASENTTVEFNNIQVPDESGTFEHGVFTANDSQTANISIETGPFFAVSDLSAPADADLGAEINVSATITNSGDSNATQEVEFRFNGSVVANETVELNVTESTTVEFNGIALPSTPGTYEHGVFTSDDNQTASINVGLVSVSIVEFGETYGDDVQSLVEDKLPDTFLTQVVNAADVSDSVIDQTDIFLFNDLSAQPTDAEALERRGIERVVEPADVSVDTEELILDVENDPVTGAVYLDQWGSDSDAISNRSAAIGDPADTSQSFGGFGPIEYTIQADHPIFDGVANASETVTIATGTADRTWFSGADGDTLAEVVSGGITDGPAATVDPDSGSVLLSSLGVTQFVGPSAYTDDAAEILANGVVFAEPELSGPVFDVNDLAAPAVAEGGTEIDVNATVENVGNESGTQDIEFLFNGTVVASTTETLNASEQTTVEFSTTLPEERGEFQHGVRSANGSEFANIFVDAPTFTVSDLSAPSSVDTGATIDVNATITNIGGLAGTQDVEFVFDGSVVANTTETLNASEQTTVEFSPTVPGQEGFFEHGVFTEDDSQTAPIAVGTEFTDVALVDDPQADGNATGTLALFEDKLSTRFTVDVVPSEDVLQDDLTDEYDIFVIQDINESTVAVADLVNSIEDDVTTGAVYLDQGIDAFGIEDRSNAIGEPGAVDGTLSGDEPAEYAIQEDHPIFDGVGTAGDTVNLTVDEDNRAWFSDAAGETLADVQDQTGVDGAGVSVDPDSGAVLLSTIMVTDFTELDELTEESGQILANAVEFAEPSGSFFNVSDLAAPDEVEFGAEVDVNATVTNLGPENGTQDVEFVFNGSVVASTTETLNVSASTTVEFNNVSLPEVSGTFEHGVFSANESQTAQITVIEPGPPNVTMANLSIAGQGSDATVLQGTHDVSVEMSHDDGPDGEVPMELTIGTETLTKNVTLNATETKTVTFENVTSGLDPGIYDVTMSAVNTTVTGELTLSVDVRDNGDPATDTNGDGLLNDADGDGEFDIFDVQAFFEDYKKSIVENNPGLFDFDDDGEVDIFDVQELFEQL